MGDQHTEQNGECFFCGKEEHGYALKDEKGEWHPACWPCCKKRVKEKEKEKENNGE